MEIKEFIFDKNIPKMMKNAKKEPVIVLGHDDQAEYVLLSYEEYRDLINGLENPLPIDKEMKKLMDLLENRAE